MINLKKFRTAKGVSQATVAKELGISRQTYNNYELGKRQADYETLLKLAEYFETTVEELITDRQKNAPDLSETAKNEALLSFVEKIIFVKPKGVVEIHYKA